MAEYIYFCSSLPFLRYGTAPPFNSEQFLQSASTNLSSFDFANLRDLDFQRASERVAKSSFFAEYYKWEVSLRNQVMLQRLKTLEQKVVKLRSGGVGGVSMAVAIEQILQQGPYAVEQGLDKLRWAKLDELCGWRLFDMVFLAAYFLKLKIVERAALWQKNVGVELYENVSEQIVADSGEV